MFQSFSGSSRRPRQVNLSGQTANPFAASSWAPTASGTQKTVAAAQQERQQRQQERDRLNATKRIQRTWRGHKGRQDLARKQRQIWDYTESNDGGGITQTVANTAYQLRLLLAFFRPQNPQDIRRLNTFNDKLLRASQESRLPKEDISPQLLRLSRAILASLAQTSDDFHENSLQLLNLITDFDHSVISKVAPDYYTVLASLITAKTISSQQRTLVISAVKSPLSTEVGFDDGYSNMFAVYTAFALYFLVTPKLLQINGNLEDLVTVVDVGILAKALLWASSAPTLGQLPSESRLWLLAHFINIHRLQQMESQEPAYLRALSVLLSISADDIAGRIDAQELQTPAEEEEEEATESFVPPLPVFVKEELISLVNKASITGLLAKFSSDYNSPIGYAADEDASLLASYALILLRLFPTLGEEIRMWLYQGSVSVSPPGTVLPAIKLFWKAMSSTSTFTAISNDSKSALTILRSQSQRGGPSAASGDEITNDREWRAILLFLELYAFVLRFTDDEEFLSGGLPDPREPGKAVSRSRESALPLRDVKLLTIFLKNLSFTMYYSSTELKGTDATPVDTGLHTYFGTTGPKNFTASPHATKTGEIAKTPRNDQNFLGIAGMTYEYVRSIVTRVMGMLYERDSRRRFLPKDHWLMTSRFDMEGFIPAVVMEEERQHQVNEEGGEIDSDDSDREAENEIFGMHRPQRLRHLENLRRHQQKASRKNVLAAVGPRLEVLQNMPYVIPFKTRVQIFRQFVYEDQLRRRHGMVDPDQWRMSVIHSIPGRTDPHEILARHHAKIRRDNIFEDAFDQFYLLGEGLKEPIQITFVDKFDTIEAGIDGGGVTKEFLTSVTNEAFRCDHGSNLFVNNEQNLLYPNPAALDQRRELLRQSGVGESDPEWTEAMSHLLKQYEFLGRVIGKCLYEGILVDIGFAGFFLLKWASTHGAGGSSQESRYLANINDLRDLDEDLYQNLLTLKDTADNVEDMGFDFTIDDTISMPGEPTKTITRQLLPKGDTISVTNENRVLYVSVVARHRLHGQPFQQTRAFLRGLGQIINPSWLSMFNQAELQTLIGGDSSEIDVDDLRRNTTYSGVYVIGDDGLEHPSVQLFWQVMKDFDDSDRRKVLKYVTSTPRAPLLGFGQLNPRFSIRDAGGDEQRLPSASTCINLLKMPRYSTSRTLSSKLLYAVDSGAGFDLS